MGLLLELYNMTERGRSLGELHQRQVKIRNSIAKAASVAERIGTPNFVDWLDLSRPSDDFMQRAGRVTEIINSLKDRAIPTLQNQLLEVSEQISIRDTELTEARANVKDVREKVKSGLLPPIALDTVKKMLADLEDRVREKTAKEQEALPTLRINLEDRKVQIGGKEVTIKGKINWQALLYLAKRSNQEITARDLSVVARRADTRRLSTAARSAHGVIQNLRNLLEENPKDPKLLVTIGAGFGASYRLNAQVEFIGESERAKKAKEGWGVFDVPLPDGRIIRIRGKVRAGLISALKGTSASNPVGTEELAIELYGVYNRATLARISQEIGYARKILANYGYTVIQPVDFKQRMRSQKARYYLEKIAKEEEVPQKKRKSRQEWLRTAVFENTLDTLDLLIKRPDASSQGILNSLGKMQNGRPFHRGTGRRAVVNGINKLFMREARGYLNRREQETFGQIAQFLGADPREVWSPLIKWAVLRVTLGPSEFRLKEFVKPYEELTGQLLTDFQLIVLARLLTLRSDILSKYGIDEFPSENAQKIIEAVLERVDGSLSFSKEDLIFLRREAIDKLKSVVSRRDKDKIFDQQGSEAQDLFINFFITEQNDTLKLLDELLNADIETFWQTRGGNVIKYWRDARLSQIRLKPSEAPHEPKAKISAIERTDPKVRKRIERIVEKIEGKNLPWPLSNPQVTKFFPRLKATVVSRARENGYIRPERGRSHHPVFNKSEVALLLYLNEVGNSLTPRQLKDLKKLVKEEIARSDSGKRQ